MRDAASLLMAVVPKGTLQQILRPFDDRDRTDWHYTPRSRNGVALKELNGAGREALHALLKQALSAAGYGKVVNILELELISPARVFLCLSGEPHKARSRERLESLVAAGTLPPAPATNSGLRVQVQRTCDVSGPAGMLVMAFATHGVRTADGDDCLLASDSLRADPETMLKARWLSAKTEAAASPRRRSRALPIPR